MNNIGCADKSLHDNPPVWIDPKTNHMHIGRPDGSRPIQQLEAMIDDENNRGRVWTREHFYTESEWKDAQFLLQRMHKEHFSINAG